MRWDGGGRKRDLDDAAEESTAELMLVRLEPAGDSDRMLCVQKRELESGPYDEQSEHQDKGQSRKSEQSSWSRRGICCSLGDALGGRCGSSALSRWLRPKRLATWLRRPSATNGRVDKKQRRSGSGA